MPLKFAISLIAAASLVVTVAVWHTFITGKTSAETKPLTGVEWAFVAFIVLGPPVVAAVSFAFLFHG